MGRARMRIRRLVLLSTTTATRTMGHGLAGLKEDTRSKQSQTRSQYQPTTSWPNPPPLLSPPASLSSSPRFPHHHHLPNPPSKSSAFKKSAMSLSHSYLVLHTSSKHTHTPHTPPPLFYPALGISLPSLLNLSRRQLCSSKHDTNQL